MIVDPDGKGLKDYWNKAAFALLSGAILHCLVTVLQKEKRIANLSDLGLMLADPEKENTVLFNEMLTGQQAIVLEQALGASKEAALSVQQFIASSAREILNKAENEMSGVVSTSVANLALYRDPIVAKNTSFCDFRIEDLMNYESPVSLYLVIRPSDIDRLRPLIRLILNIILRRLTEDMEFKDGRSVENYKYKLLLMMDEFTSLGRLEIFERSLAFMGGFGLKGYFIVQDLTQLYSAYTKDESIMSNCHVHIAYAPNKIYTAKVLSEMTGKATIVTQKTSLSGSRSGHLGRASVSISETGRALLTPDECMRLPGAKKDADKQITEAGDMLVFPAGFPPIYGKQILYFLDPVFLERAKVPTPLKSDRLVPDDTEETPTENPFIYTVEPDDTKQATDTSEIPEYSIDDEPDFEEPTFDGEEPDFDGEEPDFVEPNFDTQESA
jgi:type IV secretion system protein VirD4